MRRLLKRLLRDESGATAIEYGLIVCLISVALIGVMASTGSSIGGTLDTLSTVLAK